MWVGDGNLIEVFDKTRSHCKYGGGIDAWWLMLCCRVEDVWKTYRCQRIVYARVCSMIDEGLVMSGEKRWLSKVREYGIQTTANIA